MAQCARAHLSCAFNSLSAALVMYNGDKTAGGNSHLSNLQLRFFCFTYWVETTAAMVKLTTPGERAPLNYVFQALGGALASLCIGSAAAGGISKFPSDDLR